MCSANWTWMYKGHYLTPWSRVLLEKLIVAQLVKKFPAYATRRFIIVFTRANHKSLSRARWIQSTPSIHIYLISILILSSYLRIGLPSGLLPSDFSIKILYAFLLSPRASLDQLKNIPDLVCNKHIITMEHTAQTAFSYETQIDRTEENHAKELPMLRHLSVRSKADS
jgi:hypothetical protein